MILGTVAYMSPEQVAAEACGSSLRHLLVGDRPLRAAVRGAPVPARDGAGDADGDPARDAARALGPRSRGFSPAVETGSSAGAWRSGGRSRFQSAHDLALALEDVLGSAAARPRRCGRSRREARTRGCPRSPRRTRGASSAARRRSRRSGEGCASGKLLAVIGPSGAGKTSFVRAGVVAARPEGWAAIVATPGVSPLRGLGQALGPQLANDPEALRKLAAFEDPRDGLRAAVALAAEPRRGPGRRRPVRGALHAQPARDAGAVRRASRQARERSGRPRPALAARRLPDALSRARGPRAGLRRADAASAR